MKEGKNYAHNKLCQIYLFFIINNLLSPTVSIVFFVRGISDTCSFINV